MTEETLLRTVDEIPASVSLLPNNANLKIVGYACSSGTNVIGEDRLGELVRSIHLGTIVTIPGRSQSSFLGVQNKAPESSNTQCGRGAQGDAVMFRSLWYKNTSLRSFVQVKEATVARMTPNSILEVFIDIGQKGDSYGVFSACTNLQTLTQP